MSQARPHPLQTGRRAGRCSAASSLTPLLVGRLRIHYIVANLAAIACTGLLNFAAQGKKTWP